VPLFAQEGNYRNALSAADIREVSEPLFNAVYSEAQLGDGTRCNQAFENLVNADILTRQGQGVTERIAFKYERFYEYFVGNHIYGNANSVTTATTHADKVVFYTGVASALSDNVYLWGAVVQALVCELDAGDLRLLPCLCFVQEDALQVTIKDMLVTAIIRYGNDFRETVKEVLAQLMRISNSNSQSYLRLLTERLRGKHVEGLSPPVRLARRVAIEAASMLGVGDTLEEAACERAEATRALAIQHIYYLWKRNPEAGYELLQRLSKRFRWKWPVPDLTVAISCMYLSLMMLFLGSSDSRTSTAGELRLIWRYILAQIPLIGGEQGALRGVLGTWLRRALLSTFVNIVVRLAKSVESETTGQVMFSVSELELFFRDPSKQDRVKRLIPYVGADLGDVQLITDDIIDSAKDRDIFSQYVVMLVLVSQVFRNRKPTLEIIQKLLDVSLGQAPPTPAVVPAINTLANALTLDNTIDDEVFRLFETSVARFYAVSRSRAKGPWREFVWSEEACYLRYYYKRNSRIDAPLINGYLERLRQEKDYFLLQQFLDRLVGHAVESGNASLALRMLMPLLDWEKQLDGMKFVWNLAIDRLATMRLYFPDAIEDALEEHHDASSLRELIRVRTPSESFNGLLVGGLTLFLRDIITSSADSFLLEQVQKWLYSATQYHELKQWVKALIASIIDIVYGDSLFR
jgi:hypothetical protein